MPGFTLQAGAKRAPESALPREQVLHASEANIQADHTNFSETTAVAVRGFAIVADRLPTAKGPFRGPFSPSEDKWRVKGGHSNQRVNEEILSAKLAGALGIHAPWTVFFQGAEEVRDLGDNIAKRKDKDFLTGKPNYCIASQHLKGYHDLSSFIGYVHNNIESFFPEKEEGSVDRRQEFSVCYRELQRLKTLPDTNSVENKIRKRDCMIACFKLMPEPIRDMMDELFAVSSFLGNWDMFNWSMENMGFTILHNVDGTANIFPAMVDFGNCLRAGFGGRCKEDSLEAANTAAKKYSEEQANPRHYDYDPEITPEFRIQAAMFSAIPGLALASIPRRLPFADLFQHNDAQVVKCIENRRDGSGKLSQGFLRGLYRIACVTDETIDKIVSDWLHVGEGEAINYTSEHPADRYTKQEMADLLKARKAYICRTFTPEIERYVTENQFESEITRKEVSKASEAISGLRERSLFRSSSSLDLLSPHNLTSQQSLERLKAEMQERDYATGMIQKAWRAKVARENARAGEYSF